MSRGVRRKKSGLTRRQNTGRSGSVIPYVAIVAVIAVVTGLGYLAFRVSSERAEIDQASLCQKDQVQDQLLILLDLTDPLSQTQAQRLVRILDEVVETETADSLVAVGIVSEEPAAWGARFQKCKPKTGREANQLYENPTLIQERFEEEFRRPLYQVIDAMMKQPEQDTSPIMEAMQALIADLPLTDGQISLIVVSDLLQNSDAFSAYREENWDTFAARGGSDRLARNLNGAHLTLVRIPRPATSSRIRESAEAFWAEYFDIQGASAPFDIEPLGDL